MTNPTSLRRFGHQALVALVSVSLVVGPVAQPAYGALTLLADVPIAAKVAANPNIVYTVDDSGSMNLNYVPDFVNGVCSRCDPHNACPAVRARQVLPQRNRHDESVHGPAGLDVRFRQSTVPRVGIQSPRL